METLQPYVVALAIGMIVGLEREWSQRAKSHKLAGARTLALVGLLGGLAAELGPFVVAAGLGVVGLIIATGYHKQVDPDIGLTTEMATLAVFLLGALARDHPREAIALGVTCAMVLASRDRLHAFVHERITRNEIDDALKFLVIAFVILPFLPSGGRGPHGVLDAHHIWNLVVLMTGIGWAGYIAICVLGPNRGLWLAGFAGGFVSASATTASMARTSKTAVVPTNAPLGAAVLASIATLVQFGVVIAIGSSDMFRRVLPALAAGGLLLLLEAAVIARRANRSPKSDDQGTPTSRAFALWPALLVATLLTGVLLLTRWTSDVAGDSVTVLAGGLTGFADVHATAAAMATLAGNGSLGVATAIAAAGAALAANTVTKCVLAFAVGGRGFGTRFTLLIAGPTAVVAVGLALSA